MERLFVDTSAWIALIDRAEARHAEVRDVLREFGGRLVTSNFVVDESLTLSSRRLGHAVAPRLGLVLWDPETVDVMRVSAEEERAAWELFRSRSDQPYSFTDCTTFVVMRERGISKAATLDPDFRREGFEVVPA